MISLQLYRLDPALKRLLVAFIFTLTVGVSLGILYVGINTNFSSGGTIERFNGSQSFDNQFEVPEHYPKPVGELLMTTHNHVFGFSLIFFSIGLIFYFNSIIGGVA